MCKRRQYVFLTRQEGQNDTVMEMEKYIHDYSNRKNCGRVVTGIGTVGADSAAITAWVENQLFYFLAK